MKALFLLPYPLFCIGLRPRSSGRHVFNGSHPPGRASSPSSTTMPRQSAGRRYDSYHGYKLSDRGPVISRRSLLPADSYQSHKMDAASHLLCVSVTTNFAILVMTDSGFFRPPLYMYNFGVYTRRAHTPYIRHAGL